MYINTNSEDFVPKDFTILNFYGKETCFAWNESEFIYFSYLYKDSTDKLNVLQAPAKIKDIRCFNERIFFLCYPSGIYKLTDNLEFAILSKAGIELGSDFCEVFTPSNDLLMMILEDKKLKNTKKLFSLSSNRLHVLLLNCDNNDASLNKALLLDNSNNVDNFCIIAHDKELYKMSNQIIQIIYKSDYSIRKIHPVEKNGKIVGVLLQTDQNVMIFMYVTDNKLKYNKIFLASNVETICAFIISNEENVLLLIYSDGVKTYYSRKFLLEDSLQEDRIEDNNYNSLKLYQSKFLIYLNDSKELLQIPIDQLKDTSNQNINDYVKLEANMLNGLENIMEVICKRTAELKKSKDQLMESEDKLKRINAFIYKQHIKYCPEDSVTRLSNQIFLISNFKKVLPKNTIIVKMLKNQGKVIFSMKTVTEHDTIVEMPIGISNLSSQLHTTTDLITYKRDEKIWCLTKNYVRDPLPNKNNKIKLEEDKITFVKHKLLVLKALMKENNLSMEALSKIKHDIREELQYL